MFAQVWHMFAQSLLYVCTKFTQCLDIFAHSLRMPRLPQQTGEQITALPRLPQQKGEQITASPRLPQQFSDRKGWRLNLIARYYSIANVRATVRCGYSTSILLCYHNIPYSSFGNSISTWCAAAARRSRSSCSMATNQATKQSTKKSQTLKSWYALFCTIPWK